MKEHEHIRLRLLAVEAHMALARSEAGCPDDDTLVEYIRTLKADCNRAADFVDKLTEALQIVAAGRTSKDRSDLDALFRLREVAKSVLPERLHKNSS